MGGRVTHQTTAQLLCEPATVHPPQPVKGVPEASNASVVPQPRGLTMIDLGVSTNSQSHP